MASNRTATVLSFVALFVALGSGAYAAVSRIAANSVGPQQIKKGAVGEQELAKGSVTGAAIASNAVGQAELKADAVAAEHMQAASVGQQQMQERAITQEAMAANSVGQQQMQPGSVGSVQMQLNSIAQAMMQANSVGAAQMQAGSVGAQQMQANSIGTAALQAQAVGVGNLADSAKTTLYTDNDDTLQNITTDTQIGSLSLPAGTYLLTASIQGAHSGTGASTRLECYLVQNGSLTLDLAKERLQASDFSTQSIQFAKEALSSPVTLNAPGTITYRCASTNGSNIELTNRRLMALRVSNIVAQ